MFALSVSTLDYAMGLALVRLGMKKRRLLSVFRIMREQVNLQCLRCQRDGSWMSGVCRDEMLRGVMNDSGFLVYIFG